MTEIYPNGSEYNQPFQLCAYADATLIMAKGRGDLKSAFLKLEKIMRNTGLSINTEKMMFMARYSSGLRLNDLPIGDYAFENLHSRIYLSGYQNISQEGYIIDDK